MPGRRDSRTPPTSRLRRELAQVPARFRAARKDPAGALGALAGETVAELAGPLVARLPEALRSRTHHALAGDDQIPAGGAGAYSGRAAALLCDAGVFRTIATKDAAAALYSGDSRAFARDLARLTADGLVRVVRPRTRARLPQTYLTLTPVGARAADAIRAHSSQTMYAGYQKSRFIRQDARLYREFQHVAARLDREGATDLKVVLHYDLQAALNAELASIRDLPEAESAAALARFAEAHALRVVRGRVQIPAMRVEYAATTSDRRHIDVARPRPVSPLLRKTVRELQQLRADTPRAVGQSVGRFAATLAAEAWKRAAGERDAAPAPHKPLSRPDAREPRPRTQLPLFERERDVRVSPREAALLCDVGAFRAVRVDDLARFVYQGDQGACDRALHRLMYRQNLLRVVHQFELRRGGERRTARAKTGYVTLTPAGRRLVQKLKADGRQAIYAGIRKPHELTHDAALYPMFQRAAADLEARGCQVRRVTLDYELKRAINPELARIQRLPELDRQAALEQLARAHGLVVVDGKIPIPDVRVEYDAADGEAGRVDLEYVTANYRAAGLVPKAIAGFKLYGSADGQARGRRVLDQVPSLAAEILSI